MSYCGLLPVALIHGFAQTPASWREVEAALPASVDARAIDVTVGASWDDTIDQLAQRIGPDAIAVGYSLGARLALGLLARDLVPAAVLISVHPGLADDAARVERAASDAAWAARLRHEGTVAFLEAWEAQPLFATQSRPAAGPDCLVETGDIRASADVRARRHAERSALDPDVLARSLEVVGLAAMPDLRAALVARANRAHLVAGADDPKFLAIARTLVHEAPALQIDVVDGSGHDPTLEAPVALATIITRAVTRLLTQRV
jgi:2-succinyl-6-hydroxy-2,4-cyclohexadiene-1-carboxylate synthase